MRVRPQSQYQGDLSHYLRLVVRGRGSAPKTLESFAPLLFPDSTLKQACFVDIIDQIRRKDEATLGQLYGQLLRSRHNPSGKYSTTTISKVWVALLKSGILERPAKGQAAYFSTRFTMQLRRLAESWDDLVKDYVSHPPSTIAPATFVTE